MKKSEILEKVYTSLASKERTSLICTAVKLVEGASDSDKNSLSRWIHDLLAPNFLYDTWLFRHDRDAFNRYEAAGRPVEARLQWLDWMIQYWKAKGD